MDKENKLPSRKPTRLKDFDYNAERTYFITICTESRRKILSRIVGHGVPDVPRAKRIQLNSVFALRKRSLTFIPPRRLRNENIT